MLATISRHTLRSRSVHCSVLKCHFSSTPVQANTEPSLVMQPTKNSQKIASATNQSILNPINYNDHSWRQHNHIWTAEEVADRIKSESQKHKPIEFSDYIMKGAMTVLYHTFNFVTGYKHVDPSPGSIIWRLIILESFAGVPGFMGAAFRHFKSLRTLEHDHGMIFTLLEEAENERMHLLTCMDVFNASIITRTLVVAAQLSMTPALILTYIIKPAAVHRFVGYLEETAVSTYTNIVNHVEKPGTQLNRAWKDMPAPEIAINYWQLPEGERKWIDALKRMLADEAHHRDVNHTLASLPKGSKNPFVHEHMADFDAAALRRSEQLLKMALVKSTDKLANITDK